MSDLLAYTYALVRKDISKEQQLVQIAHAAWEAGSEFGAPAGETSRMIVLGVDNAEELAEAEEVLTRRGIQFFTFVEPDDDMGKSSICTQAVTHPSDRNVFRQWPLFVAS